MSPPYHLRRLALIWLPLLAAGVIFYAHTGLYGGLWALIPIGCTLAAITHELTETKETTA